MADAEAWQVLKHGPLVQLQSNLWQVEGVLPHLALGRRMSIAKMSNGQLVLHSPIALDETSMKSVETLGEVAFLIVPNGFHRMDAPRFKKRYPAARLYCPKGSVKKVRKVVEVDGIYDDFPEDTAVSLQHLSGVAKFEGVMSVHAAEGTSLVFNDTLFNLAHQGGLKGLLLRLMGSTGGIKVTPVMRLLAVKNKKALAIQLHELASTPSLQCLVPGHGKVIADAPAQVLRDLALSLSSAP